MLNRIFEKITKEKFLFYSMFFSLFLLVFSVLILSYVPPVSKDALTHHLLVPKLYLKYGWFQEIPEVIFSYYPMNLNIIYTGVLYFFNNDIIPKYFHFIFAVFTSIFIYKYFKSRLDKIYALGFLIFYLSIPIIIQLSISVYVDLGLIFFSFASIYYLMEWKKKELRLKYLILSAVFCGLALGTKYNALIVFFVISAMVPFVYIRSFETRSSLVQFKGIWFAVLFVIVSLLIFSPWMIKNYKLTGNPVYPLYGGVFDKKLDNVSDSEDKLRKIMKAPAGGRTSFGARRLHYDENYLDIALIPLRVFFQGKDGTGEFFDGVLNPFLLILSIFAFLGKKEDKEIEFEKKILLTFSLLVFFIAFFTADMRIRYISPIIPCLVLLSGFGFFNISDFINRKLDKYRVFKEIVFLMLILSVFFTNLNYLVNQFKIINPFIYISGKIDREEYITHFRPEYPAIKFVNNNLSEDEKIYTIFLGRRLYYFDVNFIIGDQENSFFSKKVKKLKSKEELKEFFVKRGVTHIIVRLDIFKNWLSGGFERDQIVSVAGFFREDTKLLFNKNDYAVFKIKD